MAGKGKRSRSGKRNKGNAARSGNYDSMRNPLSGVEVAVNNDAKATKEAQDNMHKDLLSNLDGLVDKKDIPESVTESVHIQYEGRFQVASVKRDGLSVMRDNGTISEKQYAAGRAFQGAFDWAGKCDYTSVRFEDVAGDGMSNADFLDKRIQASKELERFYDLVGGGATTGAYALCGIIGHRRSLSDMVAWKGHGAHVWRGALFTALDILSAKLWEGVNSKKKVNSK